MEEYNRDFIKKFIVFLVMILSIMFFQKNSFDNTILKNVEMEPFSDPVQEKIIDGESFEHKTKEGIAKVTPIANYKIYGRVADVHFRPSKLQWAAMYPYDITIGYGNFKHKEVFNNIRFQMVSTVVYWRYSYSNWNKYLSKYFKSYSDLNQHITNNHICPANKNVLRGLKMLRKKDIVYIEGYLIKFKLKTKDGKIEQGISSTSRNDDFSGDNGYGNCEQIYVTRVVSRHGDFR